MHNPLKKYKGERREMILTQRGEACNSTGVLTRLASSGEMRVFLRGSIEVLPRLVGSEATIEMKTYTLNFLAREPNYPSQFRNILIKLKLLVLFDIVGER